MYSMHARVPEPIEVRSVSRVNLITIMILILSLACKALFCGVRIAKRGSIRPWPQVYISYDLIPSYRAFIVVLRDLTLSPTSLVLRLRHMDKVKDLGRSGWHSERTESIKGRVPESLKGNVVCASHFVTLATSRR